MTLPVSDPNFWTSRMFDTLARGRELHTIIYDIDPDTWMRIQKTTAGILQRHVPEGSKILDAGCGYGAIYDCFHYHDVLMTLDYTGVDIAPNLIRIGKEKNPAANLIVGDLKNLPFKESEFDFVICRSVADMLKNNQLGDDWEIITRELYRVGKAVILIEYTNMEDYSILRKEHHFK